MDPSKAGIAVLMAAGKIKLTGKDDADVLIFEWCVRIRGRRLP